MIKAIGIDIVEVARIRKIMSERPEKFINRIFTMNEASYCRMHADEAVHFAGKFAAKEAFKKAAGTSINWTDVEILNLKNGSPYLNLRNGEHPGRMLLTISHTGEYAVAFVTIEED